MYPWVSPVRTPASLFLFSKIKKRANWGHAYPSRSVRIPVLSTFSALIRQVFAVSMQHSFTVTPESDPDWSHFCKILSMQAVATYSQTCTIPDQTSPFQTRRTFICRKSSISPSPWTLQLHFLTELLLPPNPLAVACKSQQISPYFCASSTPSRNWFLCKSLLL